MLQAINATLNERGLMLKTGSVVDATLIQAPSSTKNASGERDPEMHQTKKGNQWALRHASHWIRRGSLGSPVERAPNSSMTAEAT